MFSKLKVGMRYEMGGCRAEGEDNIWHYLLFGCSAKNSYNISS